MLNILALSISASSLLELNLHAICLICRYNAAAVWYCVLGVFISAGASTQPPKNMMAFRSSSVLFLLFFSLSLAAQILTPVSWRTAMEPLEKDVFALQIIAKMDRGWSVYSQFTPEGGPVPTTIAWEAGDHYELIGKTTEKGDRKEGMDDIFGIEVIKFLSKKDLVFTQKVRVKDYGKPIQVVLEYMCCDDEQCLPPAEEEFSFSPPPASAPKTRSGETPQQPATPTGAAITVPKEKATEKLIAKSTTSSSTQQEQSPISVAAEPVQIQNGLNISVSEPPATAADPVTWTLRALQTGERSYDIIMEAIIEEGWTLYGQDLDPEIGPVPNAFVIGEEGLELRSEVKEAAQKRKREYEDAWDAEVIKLYESVRYTQRVVLDPATTILEGTMTYMACEEVCLPPEDLPFKIDFAKQTASIGYEGLATTASSDLLISQGAAAGACEAAFDKTPVANCSEGVADMAGQGLWTIFGLGFLGGIFALIMPCIFPMIPLTVNFFNKGGKSRREGVKNAALYGFFIFSIYVLLSLPFHLIEGVSANILNDIASNVWVNVLFFLVFMFFAGSFFGYYELTVPESWANRSSKAESTGGLVGIFFMALTLALVSFSCTGPILGSLLVGTASEGAWPLTVGMAGFGLALALPFGLFAAFPQLLKSMPSSGGWLNSVKVVLGFAEVALALKFLSNADLVGHWNILKVEPFYIIWILCLLGIAAYLFGFISFPLDSKNRETSLFGGAVAIAALVFAGYIATGFQKDPELGSYQPLSLLSGISPAVCYSFWNPCDCPQGIPCFKDLDEGMAYACKVNKPVILDFTGYSCANCRKMEENVWSQDQVRQTLTDDFVLISLYVDDRTDLPEVEHQVVERLDRPGATKKIDQVGEKWHHFQQSVYQASSQPYYVLVSPDGRTLNPPVAYMPDAKEYQQFLECGIEAHKNLQEEKTK